MKDILFALSPTKCLDYEKVDLELSWMALEKDTAEVDLPSSTKL